MKDDQLSPGDWIIQVDRGSAEYQRNEEAAYNLFGRTVSPYLTRAVKLIELTLTHVVIFDPWDNTPRVLVRADYPDWALASEPVVATSLTTCLLVQRGGKVTYDDVRLAILRLDQAVHRLAAGRADWIELFQLPGREETPRLVLGNGGSFGSGSGGSV